MRVISLFVVLACVHVLHGYCQGVGCDIIGDDAKTGSFDLISMIQGSVEMKTKPKLCAGDVKTVDMIEGSSAGGAEQLRQVAAETSVQISAHVGSMSMLEEVLFGGGIARPNAVLLVKGFVLTAGTLLAFSWTFRERIETHVMRGFPHALSWLFCTAMLVLCNKAIFKETYGNFPFPLTLTSWHMLLLSVSMFVIRWEPSGQARETCMPAISAGLNLGLLDWAKMVLPLGVLYGLSMGCGNLSYMLTTVSLLQMIKASVGPVFGCLLAFAFGTEIPSARLFGIILVISVGAVLMLYKDVVFVPLAVILQLSANLAESTRMQVLQVLMDGRLGCKQLDPLTTLYFMAPLTMFFTLIAACLIEWRTAVDLPARFLALGPLLVANSVLAVTLNILCVFVIKRIKALPFAIVAVMKDIFLMSCDVVLFESQISHMQIIGFSVAATGTWRYCNYKIEQAEAKAQALMEKTGLGAAAVETNEPAKAGDSKEGSTAHGG